MVAVVCLIRPDRLDGLLEAAFAVVDRHIGVVGVTDCEILRAERFQGVRGHERLNMPPPGIAAKRPATRMTAPTASRFGAT